MQKILKNFVLSYLRFFARIALDIHKPTIIGIAGSVGKSSTRNALEAILKDHFPIKSVGNSETGIPLGILGMKPKNYSKFDWLHMLIHAPFGLNYLKGTKYLIAEMGIDEPDPPKNMEYLLTILRPDIAIVLNESATHSMQFDKTVRDTDLSPKERLEKIVQNITKEDMKIITHSRCKTTIYNADDPYILSIIEKFRMRKSDTTLLSFGKAKENSMYYGEYEATLDGTTFGFKQAVEEGVAEANPTFPYILPKEYHQVFTAAFLAGRELGLSMNQMIPSLVKNFAVPKGRSSLLKGIDGSSIIDSSYNASKASTFAFLDLVHILKRKTKREVVFLFGDMRELGKEGKVEHEEVAQRLVGIVDYLYCVGPLTREYVLPVIQRNEHAFKEMRWFDKAPRAGEHLKENMPKDAIVLVKGSQNTIFLEEAIKEILADKKDARLLCRQEEFWINTKKSSFSLS